VTGNTSRKPSASVTRPGVGRRFSLRHGALDAFERRSAFRSHEQRPEQRGQHDERNGEFPAELAGHEHEEEGVRERHDEHGEEHPPESRHTPGYRGVPDSLSAVAAALPGPETVSRGARRVLV
jgi:hypothetical protein